MTSHVTDPALLAKLNAPANNSVTDPVTLAKLDYGLDITGPREQVRAAIAGLPDDKARQGALKNWADYSASAERAANSMPNLPRGVDMIPFGKEIVAGANAGIHALSGGKIARPYDEGLAMLRASDQAQRAATPVSSTIGDVATGLMLPGPRGAPTRMGRVGQGVAVGGGYGALYGAAEGTGAADRLEKAGKGALIGAPIGGTLASGAEIVRGVRSAGAGSGRTGAYNRFASQLPDENVNTFANQVATGATQNTQTVQRRTLDILGEEMERAGGDRVRAVQSSINRIMQEFNVSDPTARTNLRNLTGAQRDSTLMLAEYPAAAPSNAAVRSYRNPANVPLQDASRIHDSNAHSIIDTLAHGPGSRSGPTVRNAVQERNLGGRDSMRGTLSDLAPRAPGGTGPRTIEDLAQMQDGARRAASMEYGAAYNAPTNNAILVGILPRIIDRHANRMAGRSGDQAQALSRAINEFRITRPDGQTVNMMTLQQLQDARGALRVQIQTARDAKQDHIVGTLQPLYRDVTRMMQRANPTWARANRRWADNSIDTKARELGEAFSLKAGPKYREQLADFQRLADEAQDMVRVEYLQKVFDKLDNIGDTHDVAKLFTNDHTRNSLRQLFGDDGVLAVTQMVRDLGIATKSGRMLQGSQTHARGQRADDASLETGILAAAEMTSVEKVKSALLKRLMSVMTEHRNRPLAEIATTPMNDMAEVARHIHNMRAAQQYRNRINQGGQPRALGLAGPISTLPPDQR